jgi:hypothetical protein
MLWHSNDSTGLTSIQCCYIFFKSIVLAVVCGSFATRGYIRRRGAYQCLDISFDIFLIGYFFK